MSSSADTPDVVRSVALGTTCAAFVTLPNLGTLLGRREITEGDDTVITPPGYAFAVWGPIFATSLVDTIVQCRREWRTRPASRAAGWPLAAAYAANTGWILTAFAGQAALGPVLLPIATGCAAVAHARLQSVPAGSPGSELTATAAGLLLGWTTLASAVNFSTAAARAGADQRSDTTIAVSTAGLAAVSALAAVVAGTSRRGGAAVAATAGWGLATLALNSARPTAVRLAAGAGAVAVVAAGIGSWRRQQARRRRR